jgi:hypothetical protein
MMHSVLPAKAGSESLRRGERLPLILAQYLTPTDRQPSNREEKREPGFSKYSNSIHSLLSIGSTNEYPQFSTNANANRSNQQLRSPPKSEATTITPQQECLDPNQQQNDASKARVITHIIPNMRPVTMHINQVVEVSLAYPQFVISKHPPASTWKAQWKGNSHIMANLISQPIQTLNGHPSHP